MKKLSKNMMLMAGGCILGAVGMSCYDKKSKLKKQFKNYLEN